MRYFRNIPHRCLIVTLVVGFVACSSKPQPELLKDDQGYKVSVTAGGKPVTDFNQQLVHRVELNRRQYVALTNNWPRGLPFAGRTEYDHKGKPSGVRVTRLRRGGGALQLGLQEKDLITAVGKKHTRTANDMRSLFTELARANKATLTLVRRGKPHKILYSLQ